MYLSLNEFSRKGHVIIKFKNLGEGPTINGRPFGHSRSSLLAPPSIAAIGRGAYWACWPSARASRGGGAQHPAKPLLGTGAVGWGHGTGTCTSYWASQPHE